MSTEDEDGQRTARDLVKEFQSLGPDNMKELTVMLGISDNKHNGDDYGQEGEDEDQQQDEQDTGEQPGTVWVNDLLPIELVDLNQAALLQSPTSGVSRNSQARHRDFDTKASSVADPLDAIDGNELRLQDTAKTATNRSALLVAIVAVVSELSAQDRIHTFDILIVLNLLIPFLGHVVAFMAVIILCFVFMNYKTAARQVAI
ncbi:uncharacterized protein B0J16DRAFT_374792 [Fusarium flagelliforme]|uniref:uncharacterized protein n=1 Tax=Fusarium flagelliforme TaxID=2675880 RepID=UPI001E8D87FC|nr:uncharacterized protein B0J16DRAFT_374792 [Fusarium flagelliforme]KAH7179798.1 hypothetical protein B0J16DRAFT_374792 [Fusarium flagelliforme]